MSLTGLRLDAHNDTLMKLSHLSAQATSAFFNPDQNPQGLHISWPTLKSARVHGAFYAAFSPGQESLEESHQRINSAFYALDQLDHHAHQYQLPLKKYCGGPLKGSNDGHFFHWLIQTIEGAYTLTESNYSALIDQYADYGVMAMAPVWNMPNCFGGGATSENDLTPVGIKIIEKIAQRRILLDVSHMNEKTFWSAIGALEANRSGPRPSLIASHSGAYALRPHPRNLKDDQLQEIANRGGIVNMVFHKDFVADPKGACLEDVVAHMLYLRQLMGFSHVGIGSDFDGCDPVAGLEDIGQLNALEAALKAAGIPSRERLAMMGGNLSSLLLESAKNRHMADDFDLDLSLLPEAEPLAYPPQSSTGSPAHTLHLRPKIRATLSASQLMPKCWIDGEVMDLTLHDQGHYSLKLAPHHCRGHHLVTLSLGHAPQMRKTVLVSL